MRGVLLGLVVWLVFLASAAGGTWWLAVWVWSWAWAGTVGTLAVRLVDLAVVVYLWRLAVIAAGLVQVALIELVDR